MHGQPSTLCCTVTPLLVASFAVVLSSTWSTKRVCIRTKGILELLNLFVLWQTAVCWEGIGTRCSWARSDRVCGLFYDVLHNTTPPLLFIKIRRYGMIHEIPSVDHVKGVGWS